MSHRSLPVLALLALAAGGCDDDNLFGAAGETIGADVQPADTTLVVGEVVHFMGIAIYGVGPGLPRAIGWQVSDAAVVTGSQQASGQLAVTAVQPGVAWLIATINEGFVDSGRVTVVP